MEEGLGKIFGRYRYVWGKHKAMEGDKPATPKQPEKLMVTEKAHLIITGLTG